MKLTFNISPVPASRPRVTRYGVYYGTKYTQFRKDIARMLKTHRINHFEGAIAADITFYIQIPSSKSKSQKEALNGAYHTQKPDIDNLQKSILDAINGIYFNDDSQIAIISVKKLWSFEPRIEVELNNLTAKQF